MAVGEVGDGLSRPVIVDEHGCNGGGVSRRPHDQRSVHTGTGERCFHHAAGSILTQGTENPGAHTESGGCDGFVYCLASDIQRAGDSPIPGGGNRGRIKALDDGIHQGHPDADNVIVFLHVSAAPLSVLRFPTCDRKAAMV